MIIQVQQIDNTSSTNSKNWYTSKKQQIDTYHYKEKTTTNFLLLCWASASCVSGTSSWVYWSLSTPEKKKRGTYRKKYQKVQKICASTLI